MDARLKLLLDEYMNQLTHVRDPRLRELIALGIMVANEFIDWKKVREKYGIKEQRSLLLKVISKDGEQEAGFILTPDGKAVPYTGIERVTVEVTVPEEVFWAIVAGKITVKEAWLRDLIKIRGENPLRDAMILIPLFETMRRILAG